MTNSKSSIKRKAALDPGAAAERIIELEAQLREAHEATRAAWHQRDEVRDQLREAEKERDTLAMIVHAAELAYDKLHARIQTQDAVVKAAEVVVRRGPSHRALSDALDALDTKEEADE